VQRSVTVLLPVYNAQSTLSARAIRALDVASDLGERFELVIVDDGSTDYTSEVAFELARDYPQIQAVRHGQRLGGEAAIRSGLKRSHGEVVFVAIDEPSGGVDPPSRPARFDRPTSDDSPVRCPAGFRHLDRGMLDRLGIQSRPGPPNYLGKRLRAAAPRTNVE
jgi:hypothetical protein